MMMMMMKAIMNTTVHQPTKLPKPRGDRQGKEGTKNGMRYKQTNILKNLIANRPQTTTIKLDYADKTITP